MTALLPYGILAQLEAANQAVLVPMGGVQFASFQQTRAIGTRGLGSCSVVVVASKYAAILAHIPPLPEQPSTNPFAGDENVREMMRQVRSLYDHYKQHNFFPDPDTYVVCAFFQGQVALPDQMEIMKRALQEMGSSPRVRTYNVPVDRNRPGHGTVVVLSDQEEAKPVVYVEDQPI
ncbi:hypothetical protein CFD26_106836 [Aspergillus turcosus]|uniref:Uncharacterized protein n=1 Tax=Aspergillus turcosus TaxID=1245748 RepID=A0A3R7IEN6_9EURO|nr:hypothetical protein CFD26_106836 [Aspergillus turcosus]